MSRKRKQLQKLIIGIIPLLTDTQLFEQKFEDLVSPCKCIGSYAKVHPSCLEQWLCVSKSTSCDICNYTFQTVERTLTFNEWIRKKRDWKLFFKKASIVFTIIVLWCSLLIVCGMKTYYYFADASNSYWSGTIMFMITFFLTTIMWFWIIIFIVLWRRMNVVVSLDKKHLDENSILNYDADVIV
ncbi:E3 ubiquitin-protein ligase MARCHF2-like isoform X2 [Daktulosphaira vitifoliae]|uniref:E3 ubiquitin-protein ligase MARCHF2-like isoform X2 n=1 Tax=Daktulosphaira vitifoliae TaxID=58002 RepID=UPI0021A9B5F5|nr:E3 ubiquitin-protein ligase MARCHF2-like isoform X2 [Daktulosphaira vitifoliae]